MPDDDFPRIASITDPVTDDLPVVEVDEDWIKWLSWDLPETPEEMAWLADGFARMERKPLGQWIAEFIARRKVWNAPFTKEALIMAANRLQQERAQRQLAKE